MTLVIGSERMLPTSSCILCLEETNAGDVCPACEGRLRREEMLRLYDEEFSRDWDARETSDAGYEPGETYIEPWEF